MKAIEERGEKEVEEIMQEADSNGAGAVREIWQMDKSRMKEEFNDDQEKNSEQQHAACMYICDVH